MPIKAPAPLPAWRSREQMCIGWQSMEQNRGILLLKANDSSILRCLSALISLQGADLRGAQLAGARLNGAQLAGADLRGTQLAEAKLYGADLTRADLYGATLTRANLSYAQLTGARLAGTQLTGARLVYAQLEGADLSEAELSHVTCRKRPSIPRRNSRGHALMRRSWWLMSPGMMLP